jgi:hypothetical protein
MKSFDTKFQWILIHSAEKRGMDGIRKFVTKAKILKETKLQWSRDWDDLREGAESFLVITLAI